MVGLFGSLAALRRMTMPSPPLARVTQVTHKRLTIKILTLTRVSRNKQPATQAPRKAANTRKVMLLSSLRAILLPHRNRKLATPRNLLTLLRLRPITMAAQTTA